MKNKFKILYVSSEVSPFAGVGNLAEVAGTLPKYLKNLGHDVRVMMPNYKSINERKYVLRDVIRLKGLKISISGKTLQANGKSAFLPNSKVQIYFLDNKELFQRDGLYGAKPDILFDDNAERFLFFSLGCLETLKLLYWQPDIIHCNDWQTALIPALLKKHYLKDQFFQNTKTVFSLCSTARGNKTTTEAAKLAGISDILKDELSGDTFDFMACGLKNADIITISDGMISEQTRLDTSANKNVISVANGIDTQIWDAQNSKAVKHHFSDVDLTGKKDNKKVLQEQTGLAVDEKKPLLLVVSEWLSSTALDAVVQIAKSIIDTGAQLLFIGQAEKSKQSDIDKIVAKNAQTVKVEKRASDEGLQNVIAGSDVLLLPNEPGDGNNWGQLYALQYGTIPVVLHSILPSKSKANASLLQIGKLSADNVLKTIKQLVKDFEATTEWQQRVHSAMKSDFSWDNAIDGYIKSYQKVAAKKK